jgi:flagellar motor switch protein FliN
MSSSPTSSSSTDAVSTAYSGMLDVTCRVEVIVGTGSITVRDCLKLQRDSIVRLEQAAGSDLQVTVQGIPAASGEIVIDDDTTSVRISNVLPPPGAEAQQ